MLSEVLKDGVEVTCSMQTRERESRWAARVMISSDTSHPSAPAIRPPNTTMCSPGAQAKTDAARRQEARTCSKQAHVQQAGARLPTHPRRLFTRRAHKLPPDAAAQCAACASVLTC
jgi:hypothetical protein